MGPIIIFGGSFDPIHKGHIAVARTALEQTDAKKVWFMPVHEAVHKSNGPVVGDKHRKKMLELAIEGIDDFKVNTYEMVLGAAQTTYDTVKRYCGLYPDTKWYLLIGEDSFWKFGGWHKPQELSELATLLVYPRGEPIPANTIWKHWGTSFLYGTKSDLSSSGIRQDFKSGDLPTGLHPEVMRYIKMQGLYGIGN